MAYFLFACRAEIYIFLMWKKTNIFMRVMFRRTLKSIQFLLWQIKEKLSKHVSN